MCLKIHYVFTIKQSLPVLKQLEFDLVPGSSILSRAQVESLFYLPEKSFMFDGSHAFWNIKVRKCLFPTFYIMVLLMMKRCIQSSDERCFILQNHYSNIFCSIITFCYTCEFIMRRVDFWDENLYGIHQFILVTSRTLNQISLYWKTYLFAYACLYIIRFFDTLRTHETFGICYGMSLNMYSSTYIPVHFRNK